MCKIKYTKHCSSRQYKEFSLQLEIKCPTNFRVSYALSSYSDVKATSKINLKFKICTSMICLISEVQGY
jgi:hypothetical protein